MAEWISYHIMINFTYYTKDTIMNCITRVLVFDAIAIFGIEIIYFNNPRGYLYKIPKLLT